MHYTLMHKEIPVVDIELDDASGAIIRVDDVHNVAHIPIGIAYKNDILDRKALNNWWYGRSIPASRIRLSRSTAGPPATVSAASTRTSLPRTPGAPCDGRQELRLVI